MRIGTYLTLVFKRVWAKKGLLFGSLLGATLVIALLVVVPLYEASVQAVDLKFSIDNALSEEVEVTAFSTQNDYDGAEAVERSRIVADAQDKWLQPWYPTSLERTQTREFLIIPSGPDQARDFLDEAEVWKEEALGLLTEDVAIEDIASPPYPVPPREATQVRLFTSPDLQGQLNILSGAYLESAAVSESEYGPIPIMIGRDIANLTGAGVGDTFFLKPFSGLPSTFEWVEVAAVVTAAEPTAAIWGLDDPNKMVYWDQSMFDRWLGVFTMDPGSDPWLRDARGLPGVAATQRWRLPLDGEKVALEDLTEFRNRLGQFRAEVARKGNGAIPTSTPITRLLDDFTTRSVVVGGPILAMLALVVGGAIYFLVYTSALTVEREGAEIALLKSRGASSWQTVGIHLGQSFVIALAAALLAPLVARFLVGITGRVPPLSTLTGGQPLDVAQVRSVVPFMVAGGIITFLAMGLAIVPFSRKGILTLRSLATRPAMMSVWQKYNIDLFAIALSLVLLLQLRLRGFINQTTGEATLDPLAVIFPALLLFTGALILLRVFPYLLRLVGWMLTKSRSMAVALAGWHLGRNPVPYGRLALLVWVTTGLGAFALTYASTLEQSYTDRAAFAAGADVRVTGEGAGYAVVPDGSTGAPVLRTTGAPRQSGRSAEVLAVRPDEFSDVVKWRSDFGADTPEEIFGLLRPDGVAPDIGVELPLDATRIDIEGIVVPESLTDEADDPYPYDTSIRVLARIIDSRTRVWTIVADADLVDTEWRVVSLDLTNGKNADYTDPPEPPLSVASLWIERSGADGPYAVDGDQVLFTSIATIGAGGSVPLDISELTATNRLSIDADAKASDAATARFSEVPEATTPPTRAEIERSPLWRSGPAVRWSVPENQTRVSTGIPQVTKTPAMITVILDREAAAIAGLDPGDVATFSIGAGTILGRVVGYIEELPTATDPRRDGLMVVDLDAVNAWANGEGTWSYNGAVARVDGPRELWIATDDPDGVTRVVLAQMADEPDDVITVGLAEAAFSSRPVQVGLVAILFVGAATGVVLALAGVTGYVLVAVTRRAREMGTLRALGFERTRVGGTFALEQFVVIGIGALIGVAGGIFLVIVMLPFFQLGESAQVIEPSILLSIPMVQLIAYIVLVGVLLIVSVVWATRRVSARKMSEILREVER
jgi:hypothetical protein